MSLHVIHEFVGFMPREMDEGNEDVAGESFIWWLAPLDA